MQALEQTLNLSYSPAIKKQSLVSQFFSWCREEEKHRFGWVAVIIAIHGCVLAPITVLAIALGGNSMVLWGLAIGAIAMPLVSNLAAMPTKITIPVFFLSVLVDLIIIITALAGIASF